MARGTWRGGSLQAHWVKGGGVQLQRGQWFRFVDEKSELTVNEVAALLGVTVTTVWRWVTARDLPVVKSSDPAHKTTVQVAQVKKFAVSRGMFIPPTLERRFR